MRHPSSDKRAAQFMFASPRRAKHVRTSSCAKALARISYTRGLASFFIVATPASSSLLNRCDQRRSSRATRHSVSETLDRGRVHRLRPRLLHRVTTLAVLRTHAIVRDSFDRKLAVLPWFHLVHVV